MRILCLCMLIGLVTACGISTDEATQQIELIKKQYAPDKRVAIFGVTPIAEGKKLILKGETNLPEAKNKLLESLQSDKFELIDSIHLLPSPDLNGKTYGIVNLSVCNIRSKSKHSSELATQALLGTPLRIYKVQGDWYRVQTPDGYLGWLDKDGFTQMNESEYNTWQALPKVIYQYDFGFSLTNKNMDAGRVSDLLPGCILALETQGEVFSEVRYPDGRTAYIPNDELDNYADWLNNTPDSSQLLATAQTFMGRPYLWGGTSSNGIDCSGFTKTVYYLHGLLLPRDASQQVKVGVNIPTDTTFQSLQAGDFLFFGRKKSEKQNEKITHVAIYLGNGKMIHAAGRVKIESLRRNDPDFAEHRLNTFVRAKRMTEHIGKNGVQHLRTHQEYALN